MNEYDVGKAFERIENELIKSMLRNLEHHKAEEEKERRLQRATLSLQDRFGKNVLLKGMNYFEGGTTRERNEQIGGHRAGKDEVYVGRSKEKPDGKTSGGSEDE